MKTTSQLLTDFEMSLNALMERGVVTEEEVDCLILDMTTNSISRQCFEEV